MKVLQLKLLNRIATVKDDGTVEFEVPGDVEPHTFDGGPADVYTECADEESLDAPDLQYIPPLQIVILIVGTRGDVQPFIAIGKKLQVRIMSYQSLLFASCQFALHLLHFDHLVLTLVPYMVLLSWSPTCLRFLIKEGVVHNLRYKT